MNILCHSDSECPRLYYCNQENYCQHLGVFDNNLIILIGDFVFPFFVGFATCGNLGVGAIQIFMLMGCLNYQQKESAAISQSLIIGVCLGVWLRRFSAIHPMYRQGYLINYRLAALFQPMIIAGLIAGIYLRNYLPTIVVCIFMVIQILLYLSLIIKNYKRLKAIETLQITIYQEVQKEQDQGQTIYSTRLTQKDIASKENITDTFIYQEQEAQVVEYSDLFKSLSQSRFKNLYFQNLPAELKNIRFTDPKTDKECLAQEYLNENYNEVQYIQVEDNDLKNQFILEKSPKVFELAPLISYDQEFLSHYYIQEPPHLELILILINSIVNIILLLSLGGKSMNSIFNVQPCSQTYWILFILQFVINVICFIINGLLLTQKQNREIGMACYRMGMDNAVVQKEEEEKTQRKILFPMKKNLLRQVFVVSLLGGFFMGYIGIGASLLFFLVLGKSGVHVQSIAATLPVIIGYSCLITSIVQFMTGYLQWQTALFYGFLSFIGTALISPFFKKCFNKTKMTSKIVQIAIGFYIFLLCFFILISIPQIGYNRVNNLLVITSIC